MGNINIFLSYCWADSEVADEIYSHFKDDKDTELHRDIVDIGTWKSIKEYMQSIVNMDYVILLISDAYLKSANCMYEVLEVMRDRNYRKKIFPAVITTEIYKPISRARYVKHWECEFKELDQSLKEINVQNLGRLNEDLKRYQDISSNIALFLDEVADMNNPAIQDVCDRIEEQLVKRGLLTNKPNLLEEKGIPKYRYASEPSDLEVNQFVKQSYAQIIGLFSASCGRYEREHVNIQLQIEEIDARNTVYYFYNNGRLVRGLKVFLGNLYSSRETIGISDCTMVFGGSNHSWNGLYEAKYLEGELKLYSTLSLLNSGRAMTVQDVVADIWKNYVQIYLER